MRQFILDLAGPLDHQSKERSHDRRGQHGGEGRHPGLLLQRYLCENATGEGGNPKEKRAILNAAILAAASAEVRDLYRIAFDRWSASLPDDPGPLDLQTVGRIIVGLGSENVLETGIRLHHTYGLPIIPGSAQKGLAAHYCDQVWGLAAAQFKKPTKQDDEDYRRFLQGKGPKPKDNFHRFLFGTTDDGGVITFHDAWITPESLSQGALRLDVMTPHHPKWQTNDAPPTDFDSPIPVSFLSVAGKFQVRLAWNGPVETPAEQSRKWTQLAMTLLQEALAEWGIGGKTSSGYGRLVPPSTAQSILPAKTGGQTRATAVPNSGDRVEAVLLEARTNRGGWRARHEPSGLTGPVNNTGDVPSDKNPGDRLTLIVASANPRSIAFKYPTPADDASMSRAKGKPKSSRG
jgi:CRISPR type III-B/RAMP module RAMP protein Cmr6